MLPVLCVLHAAGIGGIPDPLHFLLGDVLTVRRLERVRYGVDIEAVSFQGALQGVHSRNDLAVARR